MQEEEETMEIYVVIEYGDHHFLGGDHRVEGAWMECHSLAEFDQHSTGSLPLLVR